jgi:outer membrane receptor for ferrienterochelin and colicin
MKKEWRIAKSILLTFLLIALFLTNIFAQTTGKITGKVIDIETGTPLIGVNIVVEGTPYGSATDKDGNFYIVNLYPGLYILRAQMIGYETVIVKNIEVSVNRTVYLDVKMRQTVLKGEEVVVEAERVTIKKDQTSTIKNISSDEIEMLPIESVIDVISMQAGVVAGHFRGGRLSEVSYLIDGIQVDELFGGEGRMVDLEPEVVKDLEVITGTFNAEYGKAMSGVVNLVTKEGGNQLRGSISGELGNYLTPHDDIFIGLNPLEIDRYQDYKFNITGPVIRDKISFLINYRYQDNKGHLNGIRRFKVTDYSDFSSDNPSLWYSEHTGDSAYVPMNWNLNNSFLAKLTFKLFTNLKFSLFYTLNDDEWQNYDHAFKYNPDGLAHSERESNMYALNINHMLSPSLFYELKLSYLNNYYGWYLYKNPFDPIYVHGAYLLSEGPGFFVGGQQKGHVERTTEENSIKFDINWQIGTEHHIKSGFLYIQHTVDNQEKEIRNKYAGMEEELIWEWEVVDGNIKRKYIYYEPVVLPDSTIYSDIYKVKPLEFSIYAQDKMEFDEMVVNLGVRFDYFDPNTVYPTQRRNPSNQLYYPDNPENMSEYPNADSKYQISPRLGFSYQLGKTAVLHFSYGHFFQMPPMYALYQNHAFRVAPSDYETTMGNAQIKAQKTVSYEVGLWQEITPNMELDVTLFYRDIYDLLSTKIISTFNQIEYGLYTNKDYGNVRGLELKYDFRINCLLLLVNYTLQYTRGNADNPLQTFTRAGESIDPVNILIPMSWDQRHTLNATLGYNKPKYGISLTGYYNSGTPFSWQPIPESILSRINLYPNNSWIPSNYNFNLNGYYNISITQKISLQLLLSIYNLFDKLNEVWVNQQTGRAYTAIIRETDIAGHRSNFNEYEDIVKNPSMYSAPRLVQLGLGITF